MLETPRCLSRVVSAAALVALAPVSAIALDSEEVLELCEDFLLNHYGDPSHEEECMSQMALISPPANSERSEALRRSMIPIGQALPPEEFHDGDRDRILEILESGGGADVIVEFSSRDVRAEANARALDKGLRSLGPDELEYKRTEYASLKEDGLSGLQGITVLREYENLARTFVHVANEAALEALMARPEVKTVFENRVLQPFLAQSLPLIEHPAVVTSGQQGAGTTIAVLDTGVDFTLPEFGSCTSPGIPAGCRVVATLEAAPNDFALDDDLPDQHGTNVSAIAAATAGDADLVVADVFDGAGAAITDIDAGIDWAIAIQATFNIVAINLSLGDPGTPYTAACPADALAAALDDALAAGIQPIIASGNAAVRSGSFTDGIASPACVPAAVSVGNVYDQAFASVAWGGTYACTDTSPVADQVACTSQTAPILDLLAPGAIIDAGPSALGGTSQAAPHVAGAWAVFSAAVPDATEIQLLATLQAVGEPVVDTRPTVNRTTSRLEFVPEPGQFALLVSGALGLAALSRWRQRSHR